MFHSWVFLLIRSVQLLHRSSHVIRSVYESWVTACKLSVAGSCPHFGYKSKLNQNLWKYGSKINRKIFKIHSERNSRSCEFLFLWFYGILFSLNYEPLFLMPKETSWRKQHLNEAAFFSLAPATLLLQFVTVIVTVFKTNLIV